MSLILEALRKSEAERRRGQMPDLRAELPPVPARASGAPWPWRIAAAGVLSLALAAWLLSMAWRPRAGATAATDGAPVATSAALPRIARLQPAALLPERARPPRERTMPSAPAVAGTGGPAHASAPAGRQNPGAAADVQGVAVKPGATTPPRANDGNTATPATAPDLVLPPPSQLPRATDALQLSDLAADERKTLPPLKLSMHLWNDDPARRFVILDGYRLGEGDRIGGLVVTAILRDGVLLDWNGRALKVPLR